MKLNDNRNNLNVFINNAYEPETKKKRICEKKTFFQHCILTWFLLKVKHPVEGHLEVATEEPLHVTVNLHNSGVGLVEVRVAVHQGRVIATLLIDGDQQAVEVAQLLVSLCPVQHEGAAFKLSDEWVQGVDSVTLASCNGRQKWEKRQRERGRYELKTIKIMTVQ